MNKDELLLLAPEGNTTLTGPHSALGRTNRLEILVPEGWEWMALENLVVFVRKVG